MTLLRIAYGVDAVVTLCFAWAILSGGQHPLFSGILPPATAGGPGPLARLVGSIWIGMGTALVLGVFRPLLMTPVLLVQLIYKACWLAAFFASRRRANGLPSWRLAAIFLLYCSIYPWLIPWDRLWQLFRRS